MVGEEPYSNVRRTPRGSTSANKLCLTQKRRKPAIKAGFLKVVGEEPYSNVRRTPRGSTSANKLCLAQKRRKPAIKAGFLKVVGEEGFEPPTLWSQTRCATKLRYSPRCFTEALFRQRMRILRILADDARAKRSFFVIIYPFAYSATSST